MTNDLKNLIQVGSDVLLFRQFLPDSGILCPSGKYMEPRMSHAFTVPDAEHIVEGTA